MFFQCLAAGVQITIFLRLTRSMELSAHRPTIHYVYVYITNGLAGGSLAGACLAGACMGKIVSKRAIHSHADLTLCPPLDRGALPVWGCFTNMLRGQGANFFAK